jgi:alkane 1-monooxygenase
MRIHAFKYLSPLLIYVGAVQSFTSYGWACYIPLIYAWIIIPVLELLFRPDPRNLSSAEEEVAKQNMTYDLILYAVVLLEFPVLYLFLHSMSDPALTLSDKIGRTGSMGLICGTFGINVGHELGHRTKIHEQWLAKLSLMTSLYMHFFIEHNKGHHKRVATPEDPSSARYGEMVYSFWFRSIFFSYLSAWHIANNDCRKKGRSVISLSNEMIQVHFIQAIWVGALYFMFGYPVILYYLSAAVMGILLLETVNYIEHYGLSRKMIQQGKYERAMPMHSWNSDHVLGRIMLFELSRHSDHHYLASRKYQVLRHHDDAPQMPTGYPGMMLLSLVPPVWFSIMNKRIRSLSNGVEPGVAV